ncbi:MAG: EamA family transporter [Amphritea sp.]
MTIRYPILSAILVTAIWGLNVVAIKVGVTEVSPALFNLLRFSLLSLILSPFFRVPRTALKPLIALSLLMGIGHFYLLSVGASYVDSNTAVIIIMLGAPISSLLVFLMGLEQLSRTQVAGVIAAFIGAAMPLLLNGSIDLQIGAVFLVTAMVAWACTNIYVRRLKDVSIISFQFWIGFVTTPICLAAWLMEGDGTSLLQQLNIRVLAAVIYMVLFSSIIAYGLWFATISQHGVNKVVNITLLQPAFTMLFAYLILHDLPTRAQLFGGTITILGIYLYYFRSLKRH